MQMIRQWWQVPRTKEELEHLVDNLTTVTRKYGMKINVKKIKVVCISWQGNHKIKILVEGQRVKQNTQFKYLGSIVSSGGYGEKDMRSETALAKQVFVNKNRLLNGKWDIGLKKRIIKCAVWSIALYVAETWTVTLVD